MRSKSFEQVCIKSCQELSFGQLLRAELPRKNHSDICHVFSEHSHRTVILHVPFGCRSPMDLLDLWLATSRCPSRRPVHPPRLHRRRRCLRRPASHGPTATRLRASDEIFRDQPRKTPLKESWWRMAPPVCRGLRASPRGPGFIHFPLIQYLVTSRSGRWFWASLQV